jgi:predicted DNA-binding protein (MmcQ/YjbR family)
MTFYLCKMDIESLRQYCLSKKGVLEDFPFGETTLVFKVGGKIFLLTNLFQTPLQFNAKADPEKIPDLRERYDSIRPGYHMNKQHWNTITIDGGLSEKMIRELIDESYRLVFASLSQKMQNALLKNMGKKP